ncbi:unnamed protein product [Cuscuta campestris]|uniref:Ubiquitin-like protease family profile domain-containing protein n=1 Tax=Cuscuta campestris TaxID=132261 RepID=A0A484LTL2_9ASTE|nr:unnamed protein product [Cuscuta campestris]
MASTQQNAQAGRAIQKPILQSSPRHKKPEGLSDHNEMQCHSAPKPELQKSPRLKRKDWPSTLTVVQALSGSRSKNMQSHSTPLPVTPKPKPISDNVQKLIKQKRKREEGQPYGVAAAEMQSYFGVLARTKAPIWFDTWRQVPVTIKNKIWKSVTLGFDLPPSAQKLVLQSVNSMWKQFKSTLTCKYILPFRDEPERLRTPLEDFSFLEKNHWDIFVADRLSPEFLEFLREQVCSGVLTEEGDDDVLAKALGKLTQWKSARSRNACVWISRMDDLTLHGERLGEEYAKVSIREAIKDVDIPVPIPGEVLTVEQAKGTFVAWPKELIVLDVLPKGKMISFVDLGMVGTLACGNIGQRSRKLADRFKGACVRQHFLIPFNDVNHWALTVVKPNEEVVYYMDPLKRRIDSQEWTKVVDNAIVLYKSTMNTPMLKKKVSWENMAGIPMQKGSVDCGLFVMRYMTEICHDKEVQFASKVILLS